MRRSPLVVALGIPLVAAATISALAFRRANLTNAATLTVVTTDKAMLAMQVTDSSIASYVNGQLQLSFPSQQPNTTYTYDGVFTVQNRTPSTITLTVGGVAGETGGAHLTLAGVYNSVTTTLWQNGGALNSISLPTMQSATFNVSVSVDAGAATGSNQNLTLTIQGQ